MQSKTLSFADIGSVFNDANNRLEGGISAQNQQAVLHDISQVQAGIAQLLAAQPNEFQGVAGIHAQNIVDQLNLEVTAIKSVGSDPFAAKYINDVQRDLIDIVQGDPQLAALATQGGHHGFAAVPDLLVKPAPFVGNAEQTSFMQNFVTSTQDFASRAVALADTHGSAAQVQQLVSEVQAFDKSADTFTLAQGGLYSARFNNEFATNGVNGTASRALIDGLQTGNADKVHAAAEVLIANSADVSGNMLPNGSTPPSTGNGIPAHITTFEQAGVVFNDATTKMIGGVYDGNRQSIHDDLTATQQGLKDMLAGGQFSGKAQTDVNHIVSLLGNEISVVDNANAGPTAAAQLHRIQSSILSTVSQDQTLASAAGTGFISLPAAVQGNGLPGIARDGGQGGGQPDGHGGGHFTPTAPALASVASTAPTDAVAQPDHMAQIFQVDSMHHLG